jgi:hypothetical protein
LGDNCTDGGHRIFGVWHRAKVHARQGFGKWAIVTIINTEIIKHPMNWIIVFLMLTIAAIFGHLVLSLVKIEPAT